MSDRIRVLFDATALGYGAVPGFGRAGIFRVASGLITEALGRPDLDVDVAALESYQGEIQLWRYERDAGAPFGPRRRTAWRHPSITTEATAALVDRVTDVGETSPAGRKLMAEFALTSRLARPLDIDGTYDICHSLRHRLANTSRVRARARTLFVHDVIPLLFPDWCDEGAADWFREHVVGQGLEHDWITCNSECSRADISNVLPIDPARIFVVPLAADPAVFHPVVDPEALAAVRRRHGIGDRPYVLSVGTVEPRKNLAHLIDAFARLTERPAHADLQLVLVGALGWKTGASLDAVSRPGIGDRIRLTGYIPDEDLAALYAGAEVFAYPSLYEGFGLPVLEAMQCGVPVVTTTGGALPEVAGAAGLLVDPRDQEALIEALAAARGNRSLVADGLARARTFSWTRSLDLTVAAYRAMLAGR